MNQNLLKMCRFVSKNWPYGAVFAAGAGIGAAFGWIFCKKKLEKAYTDAVDKQVEEYKRRKESEIAGIVRNVVPGEDSEVDPETAESVVKTDISKMEFTPVEKQVNYNKMYRKADDRRSKIEENPEKIAAAESLEEQIGRVDSQKMNKKPKKGGSETTKAAWDESDPEDRLELIWYVEDDILADEDGNIWDEDDCFGDKLRRWKRDPNSQDIVMESDYYNDRIFKIEKRYCSYSDTYDEDLDDILYGEE